MEGVQHDATVPSRLRKRSCLAVPPLHPSLRERSPSLFRGGQTLAAHQSERRISRIQRRHGQGARLFGTAAQDRLQRRTVLA